jgi:hypothetical protein
MAGRRMLTAGRALLGLSLGLVLATLGHPLSVRADSPIAVTMDLSGHPRSGSAFTFTLGFPNGFSVPADATCSRELRWGDTASLHHSEFNETFGSIEMRGKAVDGYCDHWTLTIPYSASAQWLYDYQMYDSSNTAYDLTSFEPGSGLPIIAGSNGAAAGSGIASSSLPGVWLSMPKGSLIGDRVTATAHPIGGYVQPPGGASWLAGVGTGGSPTIASETNHRLTFTFTAKVAGSISVFYNDKGEIYNGDFAGAGIDPRVGRRAPEPTPVPIPKPTASAARATSATPPASAGVTTLPSPLPEASAAASATPSSGAIALAGGTASTSPPPSGALPASGASSLDGTPLVLAIGGLTALAAAGLALVLRRRRLAG